MNYSLTHHGYAEISEETAASLIGPPLDDSFSRLQQEADSKTVSSLVAKYRERYAEVGYAENSLYPGIVEALTTFSARGLRMGVCTSKRKDFAEKILEMFNLSSFFSFVDGGDVGIKKSDQLSGLLKSSAIDSSAIMIGDRWIDITAAKANNLRSAGVLWGFGSREELEKAGATTIYSNTDELTNLRG